MKKLIVIYYHDIVEKGKGYSYQRVERDRFEQQMKFLCEKGYTSLRFEDLEKPLPEKAVMVTFDDGFRTVYQNAAPVMRKYDIKGNVFLPTKYIEEKHGHFMTWEMLRDLCGRKEFSVAAHTHTHVDIRTLKETEMRAEIETSNWLIKERLGLMTRSFCMPYGKYDSRSLKLLTQAYPYQYVFACYYGHADERNLTNQLLPRIGISNEDTLEIFQRKLEGGLNWKGFLQRARLCVSNLKGERITQYDIE